MGKFSKGVEEIDVVGRICSGFGFALAFLFVFVSSAERVDFRIALTAFMGFGMV